jgi:hypothetical protein
MMKVIGGVMQRLLYLLISILFFQTTAESSILPENNLAIPVSQKNEGLSEVQYNQVIDKVESVYRPIIEEMDYKLTINRLWENARVNAGATKKGKEWIINLYGGYARHPIVTEDGYALVICHELGHHLGGAPKKIFDNDKPGWPSVEGQADYFATLKCLRKVFRNDDNVAVVSALPVPQLVHDKCSESFKTDWEIAICKRTTIAGMNVAAISSDIRNTEVPSVETPDESVVESTFEDHPAPQCRLDTYFQGSICSVSSGRTVSMENSKTGTCHPDNGHASGNRPACWFYLPD